MGEDIKVWKIIKMACPEHSPWPGMFSALNHLIKPNKPVRYGLRSRDAKGLPRICTASRWQLGI
jgi:hypothetical protein